MTTLLTQFGLTTAAEELVPRLTQAGHPEAMPVLLEARTGRNPATGESVEIPARQIVKAKPAKPVQDAVDTAA